MFQFRQLNSGNSSNAASILETVMSNPTTKPDVPEGEVNSDQADNNLP
jgi:hypothetical protein